VRAPVPADVAPAPAAGNPSTLTVSVVIPAHNALEYAGDAIRSVLGQSRPALEVILVDDGSEDDTARKVSLEFPQVRLLKQPHRGVAAARNRGWRAARGELIGFLDSDDRYLPDKLEVQVPMLERDPRLGLVHSGWRLADAAGAATSEKRPWGQVPRLDLESWLLWKPVFLGGMLIRRSWLEAVGGFSEDLHQAEDVDLILRLALAGCRADWCKQVTLVKRQHEKNLTRRGAQQVHSLAEVLERFFAQPRLPRRIRRMESKVRYYSSVWSAWHTFQLGELDIARECLAASLPWSPRPLDLTVVEWQSEFALRLPRQTRFTTMRSLRPVLQESAGMTPPAWRDTERLLDWTLETWYSLIEGDMAASLGGLRAAGRTTGPELAERARSAILAVNSAPEAAAVGAWWNTALVEGLIPQSQRHEVTTLHLTLLAQAVVRRQGARAARALRYAVASGWSPAAAPAWGWFMRAALRAVRRQIGDQRTQPTAHARIVGSVHSDRHPRQ